MPKKIILLILVLIGSMNSFSQTDSPKKEKPDFKEMEKAISDKNSPFFYATLMGRYTNNDTTLTTQEYRYLYYGFSFQDGYSAYGKPAVNEELKKSIAAGETEKIIELEKKALTQFPFNLRNLNTLTNTLDKKGDVAQANLFYKKLLGVGKAIMSTGDGYSDSTAMYVISVEHEYDMIGLMGYKMGGSQSLIQTKNGPVDKMKLDTNEDGIEYLYFNVDRLFASMRKMFKEKN